MSVADESGRKRDATNFHAFGISAWTVTGEEEPVPAQSHALRAASIRAVLVPRAHLLDVDWGLLDDSTPQRLVEVSVTVYPPYEAFEAGDAELRSSLIQAGAKPELAACLAGLTRELGFEQFRRRLGRFVLNLGNGVRVAVTPGQRPHVRSAADAGGA